MKEPDWSRNIVARNMPKANAEWISDIERVLLEFEGLKNAIREIAADPATNDGDPLLSASRFDPQAMEGIQLKLRECLVWIEE